MAGHIMRLYQRQVALLVPKDGLLYFWLAYIFFFKQKNTFFIRDQCTHLSLSLYRIQPYRTSKLGMSFEFVALAKIVVLSKSCPG